MSVYNLSLTSEWLCHVQTLNFRVTLEWLCQSVHVEWADSAASWQQCVLGHLTETRWHQFAKCSPFNTNNAIEGRESLFCSSFVNFKKVAFCFKKSFWKSWTFFALRFRNNFVLSTRKVERIWWMGRSMVSSLMNLLSDGLTQWWTYSVINLLSPMMNLAQCKGGTQWNSMAQ